ncbi:hypothetical protein CK203_068963 [Vitis vinifera]|uniref:DUF4283 domain-containing protein n=1 Tax=Vitis vinifera TaxID=29760 RepID=A0A438F176_VITVI|nr:hypothetical protein CK203_068963 [Vitis vinifera]
MVPSIGVMIGQRRAFSIFIPKGRGAKGGWILLAEAPLCEMESRPGGQAGQEDKGKLWIPMWGKSFAEVVKQKCSNGDEVVRRSRASSCDWKNGAKERDGCVGGRERKERPVVRIVGLPIPYGIETFLSKIGEAVRGFVDIDEKNGEEGGDTGARIRQDRRCDVTSTVEKGKSIGADEEDEGGRAEEKGGWDAESDSWVGRSTECSRGLGALQLRPKGKGIMQSGPTEMGFVVEPSGSEGLSPSSSFVGWLEDGQRPMREPSGHLVEAQSRGPSSGSPIYECSLFWEKDELRRLREAEAFHKEQTKTDLALVEEAKSGEFCDLSGPGKKCDEDENPLQMIMGSESPLRKNGECWDLVEVSKSSTDDVGKDVSSDQIVPRETKIETLSEGVVRSLGSGRWSNWTALDALGTAGGILDRDCLWEELGAIRGLWEEPWCIGGDFNVILSQRERSRQGRLSGAMRNFAQTVDDLELIDLPMQGGIATWSGGRNNQSWARLDRFLVTQQWLDMFSGIREHVAENGTTLRVFSGGGGKGLRQEGRCLERVEVNKNSALQQLEHWDGVESERRLSMAEAEQKKEAKDAFYKWVLMEEIQWRQKSRELC